LKTDERITKGPAARIARPWLRPILALLALSLIAALGYWAYRNRPTSEAEIVAIETLIKNDQGDEARGLTRDALIRSKEPDALKLRLGRAYLRHGNVGPATALLAQVEPVLIKEERLAMAEYFLVQGDPFSAVRFYEAALRTGIPRTASLLGRYGEALALSANGEGAVAAFREALTLDVSRDAVRVNLAVTLANLGRLDEARSEVLRVLKTDPANEKAVKLLTALGGATRP
jgi:predicted Zn-dependent protease